MRAFKFSALALLFTSTLCQAWNVTASDIDNWGLINTTGISGPDADYGYASAGGSSQVLDKDGQCIGFCGTAKPNDPTDDVWKLDDILNGDRLSMKFQVTDYTESSKSGWGWAYAGYTIGPILDEAKTDVNLGILGRTKPMELTGNSTLYYVLKYTSGKRLWIELLAPPKADGTPGYEDATHGVPRFEITGTGADQTGSKNVSAIKYSWGSGTPDYSKAVAIGFKRYVAAGSQGASFPTTEPTTTDFDFMFVSNENCGAYCLYSSSSTISSSSSLSSSSSSVQLSTKINGQYTNGTVDLGPKGDTALLQYFNIGNTSAYISTPYFSNSNFHISGSSPGTLAPGDSFALKVWGNATSNQISTGTFYLNASSGFSTKSFNLDFRMGRLIDQNIAFHIGSTSYQPNDTVRLNGALSSQKLILVNIGYGDLSFNSAPQISGSGSGIFSISPKVSPPYLASGDSLAYTIQALNTSAGIATLSYATSSGTKTLYLLAGGGNSPIKPQTIPLSRQGQWLHYDPSSSLQIMDYQGRIIPTTAQNGLLDLGSLEPGAYIAESQGQSLQIHIH